MSMFLSIASVILALLGAFIVIMNCACVVVSLRNQHRGIDRHHSTVPFVGQLLLCVAGSISAFIPRWILWSAAFADISLWFMLIFLVRLPFRRGSQASPPIPK
jgi:hypothetical protein